MSCLQYKNIIVDKNQSIPYFPPHCSIQCSIPSKVCPLRKRLPLSCHKNTSQMFDATKFWKHTIPLTYNTKTLISNIPETHRFSPQMRLIAYPDHKTTLNNRYFDNFVYFLTKTRRKQHFYHFCTHPCKGISINPYVTIIARCDKCANTGCIACDCLCVYAYARMALAIMPTSQAEVIIRSHCYVIMTAQFFAPNW